MDREEHIRDIAAPAIVTLTIIVFAMVMGVGAFAGYVLFSQGMPNVQQLFAVPTEPITIAAAVCAVSAVVMSNVIPRITAGMLRGNIDPKGALEPNVERCMQQYTVNTIIVCALLEAPAFLGVTAYMFEGEAIGIVVAVLMILGIATQFPTPGRVAAWIENQLRGSEDAAI